MRWRRVSEGHGGSLGELRLLRLVLDREETIEGLLMSLQGGRDGHARPMQCGVSTAEGHQLLGALPGLLELLLEAVAVHGALHS